ncbi:PREDICTED: probable rRNA-processing protein EBP2 homolog [Lupinus angustifolius]|nr:PREDICTED: probable rRNA-processing protein EBP2 homolog [Lupinus angustifolius]XP_019461333.1 PREDICTED: probable rRNA-processing protein EBP2 homolog [Lupinus angustifolius]
MGVRKKETRFVTEDTTSDDKVEDLNEEVSASESGSESGSESEGDEDVKLPEPSKIAVNNRGALLDKLGDIIWPENVEWTHKLAIDIDQEQEVDVNDDLARELAFYTQALEGTKQAFDKIQSTGQPFLRPPDYYAEMVKTDTHMVKVKGRLLAEKRKMEEADERRKARESKKLAKEIQAQKTKERAKQKKEDIESVKQWRKQRQKSGFASGGNDAEFNFEDGKVFERSKKKRPGVLPGDRSGGKARQGFSKGKKPNKRESRDSKFGFGGRKGLKKQNTADTTYGINKGSAQGNKKRKR